jgi:hypothetical protein
MLGVPNSADSQQGSIMSYAIKEFLSGRLIAEYSSTEPTAYRAAGKATGHIVTTHRAGNFFLEVTDMNSGRMTSFEYADLPY